MFKKIALLAGAGALAFGAVAPMAAATPTDLSKATCDQAAGASKQLSLNTIHAAEIVTEKIEDQTKAQAAYDAALSNASAAHDKEVHAKGLLDKANGNNTAVQADPKASDESKKDAQRAVTDAQNAYDQAAADNTEAQAKVAPAKEALDEAVNATLNANTKKNLVAEKYYENLDVIKACKANNMELKKLAENCDDAAAVFANAQHLYHAAVNAVANAKDMKKSAASVSGEYAAGAAKEAGASYDKAVKGAEKAMNDAFGAKNSALKDMLRICGVDVKDMKDGKKLTNNKVNNAAAKEGKGLAATGSVASVAGLLSALAVLAGGAFVGIRRFNS